MECGFCCGLDIALPEQANCGENDDDEQTQNENLSFLHAILL
jgi:hypothetical protein